MVWSSEHLDILNSSITHEETSLKAFNSHEFGNIREKVVEAIEALQRAQADMLGNPSNSDLVGIEKECLSGKRGGQKSLVFRLPFHCWYLDEGIKAVWEC